MKFKAEILILFILSIVCASLITICIHDGHDGGGDDFALYIEQARAITDFSLFELFELNKYSMDNSNWLIGPYLYPNGFPLMLAPFYYIWGCNFILMKFYCGIFLLLSIPLMYYFFRNLFTNKVYVFVLITRIVLHPQFITFCDFILSDLPFFFFCLLSILFIKSSKLTSYYQLILGFTIFFSYLIRDIGIILLPTLMIYQLQYYLSKKPEKLPWFHLSVPYLIFIALFAMGMYFLPPGGDNHLRLVFDSLSFDLLKKGLLYNIDLLLNYYSLYSYSSIVKWTFLLFVLVGVIKSFRENAYLVFFSFFYFIILVIWPAQQGIRFLFPLLPFVLFFTINGIIFLFERLRINGKIPLALILTWAIIWGYTGIINSIEFSKVDTNYVYTEEQKEVYEYISYNVPGDEVIGYQRPRALRLFTNKNSIGISAIDFEGSEINYFLCNCNRENQNRKFLESYSIVFETANYLLVKKAEKLQN